MRIDITRELGLFGGSVVLGLCMGLLYDVLRAVRVRFPRLGGWLDGACCVLWGAGAFFYVLRCGGELRLYVLLGCAGGCVLFFCLLSELLRPLWAVWVEATVVLVRGILFPLRLLGRFLRKVANHAKNLFLFCKKWYTIWNYKWAVIRIHRERGATKMAKQEKTAKKPPRTKGSAVTKVLILALLVLFGTQLYRLQGQVEKAEAERTQLAAEVEAQRQENASLAQDIENGDDQELMQKIAREELGLVNPGEKVFYDISN